MFNINKFLFRNPVDEGWLMNPGERAFFYFILQNIKIGTSIEIGRYKGGSTIPMAQYSNKCISIDPIPIDNPIYSKYVNLTLINDYSWNVLDGLFKQYSDINLILVDGDHETESVKKELDIILTYVPKTFTIVLLHDTFYPQVRKAMDSVDWDAQKHVHFVDLDIVQGTRWELGCMCNADPEYNDISGMGRSGIYHLGFGMFILFNEPRDVNTKLIYHKSHQKVFEACMRKEPW